MNKTEAAEIIATRCLVEAAKHGVTKIDRTFVAEIVSQCEHQTAEGSPAHQAALVRPSFQTVCRAGRKMAVA